MQRRPEQLNDDERYRTWMERIHRIQTETADLFWNRKIFRAVDRMFETNPELGKNTYLWNWLAETYRRDAAIAVRREMDGQAGAENLYHLLHEMEKHAPLLTRTKYHAFFQKVPVLQYNYGGFQGIGAFPTGEIDVQFDCFCGPPGPGKVDDHIPRQIIACDRKILEAETKKVVDYAQRLVAHRTPTGQMELSKKD